MNAGSCNWTCAGSISYWRTHICESWFLLFLFIPWNIRVSFKFLIYSLLQVEVAPSEREISLLIKITEHQKRFDHLSFPFWSCTYFSLFSVLTHTVQDDEFDRWTECWKAKICAGKLRVRIDFVVPVLSSYSQALIESHPFFHDVG